MTQDGKYPRNDAHGEAHTALYALMAGAEGCGPAERTARLAQDDDVRGPARAREGARSA